jgi:hypothetical protein
MERELSREEFYAVIGGLTKAVDDGFDQVNKRLDTLNGKTHENVADIAVLKALRAQEEKAEDTTPSRRKEVTITSAIAAGVVGAIEIAKMMWSKP